MHSVRDASMSHRRTSSSRLQRSVPTTHCRSTCLTRALTFFLVFLSPSPLSSQQKGAEKAVRRQHFREQAFLVVLSYSIPACIYNGRGHEPAALCLACVTVRVSASIFAARLRMQCFPRTLEGRAFVHSASSGTARRRR